MKKLFTLALILIIKSAFAQKDTIGLHVPYIDGSVTYEKVVSTAGKTHATLFNNAVTWLAVQPGGLQAIQLSDSVTHRLVTRQIQISTFDGLAGTSVTCKIHFALQIDCRDGKYRCRINNILLECKTDAVFTTRSEELMQQLLGEKNDPNFTNNMAKRALQTVNETMAAAMASLNKSMNDDF